jgi:hypothetical protein
MNRFLVQKGISNVPLAFLNGIPVEGTSPDQIAQGLINKYFEVG